VGVGVGVGVEVGGIGVLVGVGGMGVGVGVGRGILLVDCEQGLFSPSDDLQGLTSYFTVVPGGKPGTKGGTLLISIYSVTLAPTVVK